QPARTAARYTPATVYGRRRRVLLGTVLALFLAGAGFASSRHPPKGKSGPLSDHGRTYTSAVRWPREGQAALVLGNGRPAASPHERPAPIASLAKVMAAYVTLERY